MRFSFLKPPPASQTAEAPVRDKEFGSLRGARRTWVPRNIERERNTHWAGWRQSGLASWRAAGRAANLVDERRAELVDPVALTWCMNRKELWPVVLARRQPELDLRF